MKSGFTPSSLSTAAMSSFPTGPVTTFWKWSSSRKINGAWKTPAHGMNRLPGARNEAVNRSGLHPFLKLLFRAQRGAAEELDLHGPVGLRLDELDEDVAGLLLRADGSPHVADPDRDSRDGIRESQRQT